MSMQLQSTVLSVSLEEIEPLRTIKNEPHESENGIDDIPNSLDEEIIPDVKKIDIVSHELSEELIKSETVSENTFENIHSGSVETQVFVKTENIPLIKTEDLSQNEYLYKIENISDGNVSRGTSQGMIEVQEKEGSNEHFDALQSEKPVILYCCKKCTFISENYLYFKRHKLSHKTKAEVDGRYLKYRCEKCKFKTCWTSSFRIHKLKHLKPEEISYFYCYHCTYKCKEKSYLKSHIFNHFKNEEVSLHCYICDFTTLKRNLIIEHFKKHPKHHSKCDETDCKNQLETYTKKKKRYDCKKCLFRSVRYERLKLHELTHKTEAKMDDRHFKYRCDKCKYKTIRHQNFKTHKLIHLQPEEIQYLYCYHCLYKSKYKSSLTGHIFRHFKNEDVPFHCYICNFVTLKRDLIIEHFKTHPKHHSKYDETEYKYQLEKRNKRYVCEKCSYTGVTFSHIKQHQLTHKRKAEMDDGLLKYRCDQCNFKTCYPNSFKTHKIIHLKPEQILYFYCHHCSYKSKRKGDLKSHIFNHFKNEEVPFQCYICDFVTLKRNLIMKHFKKHPKHHSKCDETDYKKQLKPTYTKKQVRCCCAKCTYTSGKSSHFKFYQLTHKTKAEMNDLLKYRCDKCKYTTRWSSSFNRHKVKHLKPEEIQYFYCYHCAYKNKYRKDLKIHIFNHLKNEEVPFHCYICDFTTLKRNSIIEHLKKHPKHHSKCDETDYKNQFEILYFYCYHCPYKCKQKSNLKTHIFKHFKNEEVLFHCYFCDFETLKRDLIIEHFKKHPKHHNKCNERDYKNYKNLLETYTKKPTRLTRYCCEKCTYTSNRSNSFKLHQLTHKTKAEIDDRLFNYRCDKCEFKTLWATSFKTHKLSHLKPEEIPYLYCYHCSYKSKHKAHLRDHIFRHFKNEDVPFNCYICDFTTLKRNLIIEHFKKHPKHHSK